VILLDFAVQAVHVTNQSMIFASLPEARSRLVATYMMFYSIGSGVGSIASTSVYARAGWTGVSILGATISMLRSATRMATPGCSRKSQLACPVVDSAFGRLDPDRAFA
jgi:predicted MFS family arabinose efflux permease